MDLSSIPFSSIMYLVLLAIIVAIIINFMYFTPKYKRMDEGFFGGVVRGSGQPDCLRTLPETSQILDVLQSRMKTNKSADSMDSADYRELQLILSKLACLKKDLMSPSGIVDATRYQAFETAHDRINVAELCGMCLNQTIPSRDLDITFTTWRDRGMILLRNLSTDANLSESESSQIEGLFKNSWSEVYELSKSRCLKTEFSTQNGGDVGAYEPEDLKDLRSYDYKYGGLSASGWNGAV
jgi:hypothetical protein